MSKGHTKRHNKNFLKRAQKYCRLTVYFAFLCTLFNNQPTLAYSATIITGDDVSVTVSPSDDGTSITSQSINVISSCRNGYNLSVATPNGSSLYRYDGDNQVDETASFSAVNGLSPLNDTSNTNKWGYSLISNPTSGTTFLPLTTEGSIIKASSDTANSSGINDSFSVSYGVHVGDSVLSGQYKMADNGAIVYYLTMDYTCNPYTIRYDGNGADGGEMTQTHEYVTMDARLRIYAPNYSRAGYGFAGWNTKSDGTGTMYGPDEEISAPPAPESGVLTLYAQWVESAGNMQDWAGCSSMNTGSVTALTDTRDGNVYAVAKLADENCWMTENLRLNPYDNNVSITATNTNNPTEKFMTTDLTELRSRSSSWDSCTSYSDSCLDKIVLSDENIDRNNTASPNNSGSTLYSWYSYGNYYNWYTATAGNGKHNTKNIAVAGDICPKGWHLQIGNVNGELSGLYAALGNNQNNMRKYPNNFVNSGYKYYTSSQSRGGGRFDWTTAATNWIGGANFINTYTNNTTASIVFNNSWPQYYASTVRCIAGRVYTLSYDGNMDTPESSEPATLAPQMGKSNSGSFTFTIQNSSLTRSKMTFLGWSTDPNASTPSYSAGDTITVDSFHNVLYAVWGCDDNTTGAICYESNADNTIGKVYVQTTKSAYESTAISAGGTAYLTSSNYSRPGYGFIGWNTEPDGTGQIYGPSNSITMPESGYLKLYAMWVKAEVDDNDEPVYLQNWMGCPDLDIGEIVALTDSRDSEVYAIAKLADENCWQIENLRLDLYDNNISITADNTNNPTQYFMTSELEAFRNKSSTWENCINPSMCSDNISMDRINIEESNSSSPSTGPWYSYGGYYNWYTATAGNGTYSMAAGDVAGDICPSGWHIPSGSSDGEIAKLSSAITSSYSYYNLYPNNFVLSGGRYYGSESYSGLGNSSYYWSSTANSNTRSYATSYSAYYSTDMTSYYLDKMYGLSIRCVATYPKKAILETGYNVNSKMKSLAEGVSKTYQDASAAIKAIKRANALPDGFVASSDNTISDGYFKTPVYMFYDNTDDAGIMYFYSEADIIYLNTSGSYMFYNMTGLSDITGLAEFDTSKTTDLSYMFLNDSSLVSLLPLANWDVSRVKRTISTFEKCSSIPTLQGLENWQTSSLSDTYEMFESTSSLTDISALLNWDTSHLSGLSGFRTFKDSGITNLHGLENWTFPSFHETFNYASNLSDISAVSNWDMTNQTDRYMMLSHTALTSLDGVEDWGPTPGDSLNLSAFWYISTLNDISALGSWDVSSKTSLSYAFYNFPGLTNLHGLENWDVSNVQDMSYAFSGLSKLTDISAIGNWNTINVTNMNYMFSGASSLVSADALNDWDISNVSTFNRMFSGSPVHPTFSNRAGTWDTNGTFNPTT